MAKMTPEVVTGKEWEMCVRLEEETSLSLFPPITVEAIDRSRGPPGGASISLSGFKTYHQNFHPSEMPVSCVSE